jgi:hypothetical protein
MENLEKDRLNEEAVLTRMKAVMDECRRKMGARALDRSANLVKRLEGETGLSRENLQRYKLFHVLAGSTFTPENSPDLDLPDGKIQKAIESFM